MRLEDAPFSAELGGSQIILDAAGLAAPVEVPGGLEGLPTFEEIPTDEVMGKNPDGSPLFKTKKVPISYYWKEVARVPDNGKDWVHRGAREYSGEPVRFTFTPQGFDQTVANFNERKQAGIAPFLPDTHVERKDASKNNGEVIALERRGGSLHAKLKVVGSNSIEKLLKNDVSVMMVDGNSDLVIDATGKRYKGMVLHHVALTPNPQIPHLAPFVKIAASADHQEQVIPVFKYATSNAAPSRRRFHMMPATAQQVRAKLGFGADVPDDQLDDRAAEKAIALSAEIDSEKNKVAQLTIERDKAKAEADAAKQDKTRAIAASADVAQIDAGSLRLTKSAFKQARDRLITSGIASVAQMDELDKEFFVNGNPTNYAIQCSAEGDDPPRYIRHLNTIESIVKNGGIRHNNQVPRGATPAQKNVAASADGTEKKEDEPDPKEVEWLRRNSHLPAPAAK